MHHVSPVSNWTAPFPDASSRSAVLVRKTETSPETRQRKTKKAARKKLLCAIREQQRIARSMGLRAVALTLTYARDKDFCSKHISRFCDAMREDLKKLGYTLPYAWVLERAGRLHYHLIAWLPRSYKLDRTKLSKWWKWGFSQVESCRGVQAWGRYMAKFHDLTTLPKRARSYGHGGLDEAGKEAVFRVGLPPWLAALLPAGHRARRMKGGGWVDLMTGEALLCPIVWTPKGFKLAPTRPPTGGPAIELQITCKGSVTTLA